jgi:hypothetical protein
MYEVVVDGSDTVDVVKFFNKGCDELGEGLSSRCEELVSCGLVEHTEEAGVVKLVIF